MNLNAAFRSNSLDNFVYTYSSSHFTENSPREGSDISLEEALSEIEYCLPFSSAASELEKSVNSYVRYLMFRFLSEYSDDAKELGNALDFAKEFASELKRELEKSIREIESLAGLKLHTICQKAKKLWNLAVSNSVKLHYKELAELTKKIFCSAGTRLLKNEEEEVIDSLWYKVAMSANIPEALSRIFLGQFDELEDEYMWMMDFHDLTDIYVEDIKQFPIEAFLKRLVLLKKDAFVSSKIDFSLDEFTLGSDLNRFVDQLLGYELLMEALSDEPEKNVELIAEVHFERFVKEVEQQIADLLKP